MASPEQSHERLNFLLTLRRRGVIDQSVLRAMDSVPREEFVEPADRPFAYADTALPIRCGQTISQPFVVAYMTEQLQVRPQHRVLEIGTGSGYQAAVLSHLAHEVVTLERFRTLAERARNRLEKLGRRNVEVIVGDGFSVPDEAGLFDRIVVTAAMDEVPQALQELLNPGGLLIAPVGPVGGAQALTLIRRDDKGFSRSGLIGVRFVPALPGVAQEL